MYNQKKRKPVKCCEQGTLETMCNSTNAGGTSFPPFYRSSREQDAFLKKRPSGCYSVAQKIGWMTEEKFRD